MRWFFPLIAFTLFLNADEMQRLDSIVKDIENLRINYDLSQEELKKCQVELQDQKEKNALMSEELSDQVYKEKIIYLENQIKKLNKSVLLKDKEIEKLKIASIEKEKNQTNNQKSLENKINQFPKLKMRAFTYRLNQDSSIYADKNETVIDQWEKSTSFTSTLREGEWIKITGYFIDKQWIKAQKPMWVKASNAIKRD